MKKQLIFIILLLQLSIVEAQDYLPVNIDSIIHSNKNQEFIKLTDADVEFIEDSIKRTYYYEGGAIIMSKELRMVVCDTLYIEDVTGIPLDRLLTKTNRLKYPPQFRLNLYQTNEIKECHPSESMPYFSTFVYNVTYDLIPVHWNDGYEIIRILNPEYKDEYPDIPIKETILSFPTNHLPYAAPKEELNDTIKEKLNNIFAQPSEFEDEENYYYLFPSGYYYDASTIDCEESNKAFIIKIQHALTEKGYKVEATGEMNEETRKALTLFTKENVPLYREPGEILRALDITH